MEKEPDSLATVQMKPEYAPSEYSSSSEPPPVSYKHWINYFIVLCTRVGVHVFVSFKSFEFIRKIQNMYIWDN